MNRTIRKLALLAFPLMMVGCEADDPTVDTMGTADTTAMATSPATGMDTGAAQGMASTVALQPLAESGVSGEATLTETGQQMQVMVRLVGSEPDARHEGHIHQGTCDDIGPVVVPLQPVQVDAQGSGTSTSTVDLPMQDAADGQHLISYHAAGGSPGPPVTCGEIPAHVM